MDENNGYQFIESEWAAVSGPVWKKESWEYFTEPALFPPAILETLTPNQGGENPVVGDPAVNPVPAN